MEDAFDRDEVARYRVAVRSHLAAARAFYSALNFEHEQERHVLGRPMVFLTKRVAISRGESLRPATDSASAAG
jgi:hypothetical protein